MPTQVFINLPVRDLGRSIAFFKALGFEMNPKFTDITAACMVVSPEIYVMLLTERKFRSFTPKEICDTTRATEVLVCLTCESRLRVKELIEKAVEAGGSTYAEPQDYEFMYGHGFQDPDGHIWELVYMDPEKLPEG